MSKSITQVNYDELQRISKSLHNESEEILRLHSATRQKVEALRGSGWTGEAATAFFREQEGQLLPAVQRVSRALGESETVLNQIMSIIHEADAETASYFKGIGNETGSPTPPSTRQQLQERWNNMNFDERKKWLEDRYQELCKKRGLPPVAFKVEDIPDQPEKDGKDSLGGYRNGFLGWFRDMRLDSDNVKGKDPFELLGTIEHETQHEYQHYLVEHPNQRPDNISLDQIKIWKDNFEHYKSPKYDFQAYLDQPVEVDARKAEERVVADFLSGSPGGDLMFADKEKLAQFLVKEWDYPPFQAPETAEKLFNMEATIREAFEKWLANREFPETPVFSGLSPRALSKLVDFKPPAVFLLLDWICKEPNQAFSALEKEFGKSFQPHVKPD